jgi:geranylgeranylglycerol-phosphate geranylgeranyltransferase
MKLLQKIKYFIILARPNNLIIAFLSVWVAAIVAGSIHPLQNVILASVSAVLITVGANVINDIFDIEIDRINKPQRPIPAGKIDRNEALVYFIVVYLFAWILASMVNFKVLIVAISFALLLILYSYKLKRTIIIGNFVVSLTTGMAFIYGGLAVERIEGTIFPALFAFFFHFGREIIKDLQDVEGDEAIGACTFAVRYGNRASLMLTSIIFTLLGILTIIPYILGIYGNIYLSIIIAGIYPVLIYVLYKCWSSPSPVTLGRMSSILKADMIVGLIAIYFG